MPSNGGDVYLKINEIILLLYFEEMAFLVRIGGGYSFHSENSKIMPLTMYLKLGPLIQEGSKRIFKC